MPPLHRPALLPHTVSVLPPSYLLSAASFDAPHAASANIAAAGFLYREHSAQVSLSRLGGIVAMAGNQMQSSTQIVVYNTQVQLGRRTVSSRHIYLEPSVTEDGRAARALASAPDPSSRQQQYVPSNHRFSLLTFEYKTKGQKEERRRQHGGRKEAKRRILSMQTRKRNSGVI